MVAAMMKRPGLIRVRPFEFDDDAHEFAVEVHVEMDDSWLGYSRVDPHAGWASFSKSKYRLVADERGEVR